MSAPVPSRNTSSIQSVDRAVSIMELLANRGAARVTDLAREVGIHKSTAFRILSTLEAHGLVEQDGNRGLYRLSFGVVRLAGGATSHLDLRQHGQAELRWLAETAGETVCMAIEDGGYAVNVDQVGAPGAGALTTLFWVGQRTPLHATSTGKVLLAHLPDEELTRRLSQPLERFTPHTVTDPEALRASLEAVREDGYAVTVEELEIGLNAIAAPVRAADGAVVASISLSGLTHRIGPDRYTELAKLVVAASDAVSRRLGWAGTGS